MRIRSRLRRSVCKILGVGNSVEALKPQWSSALFLGPTWEGFKVSVVNGSDGDRIPFFLLRSTEKRRRQPIAIVLHRHPWRDQYSLGKSEMVGLVGNHSLALGRHLANAGFAVIAPDSVLFEDRNPVGSRAKQYEEFLAGSLLVNGKSLLGKMISDVLALVSFAINEDVGDCERLACVGFSMGGTQAYFAAAMDERIKLAVPICAVRSYRKSIDSETPHPIFWYPAKLLQICDIPEILALIAPRPLLVVSGEEELRKEGAGDCVSFAKMVYGLYKVRGRIKHLVHDEGHTITPSLANTLAKWLDTEAC